jgi:AhpD family alkylhydroperoxidase
MPRLKSLEQSQGAPRSQELMGNLESQKMLLNIFRGMANSPAVLDAFLKFSGALREGKLDAKTRESIALAVGQANRTQYCLAAHTALGAKCGLDDAAIRNARLGQATDRKTAGAVALAQKLVNTRGVVAEPDITAARAAGLDDGDLAEVVANVALNIFTNYFNNMNQTEVDFPKVAVEVP